MNKQRNREPFFARLLDDQGSGSGIETKKYPSDAEDNPWADSPLSEPPCDPTYGEKSMAKVGTAVVRPLAVVTVTEHPG